jgi:predicted nucleic acid-binding protein
LVTSTFCPNCSVQSSFPRQSTARLSDASAPSPVQTWIATPPDWLKIQPVSQPSNAILDLLDPGERAAILLAQELNADLLLLDDMKARRTATQRGFAITGILGILDQAATMKLIDLPAAVQNLQSTSFWASDSLFQTLLDKHC